MAVGLLRQRYDGSIKTNEWDPVGADESQYSLNVAYGYASNVQFGFTVHRGFVTSSTSRSIWADDVQDAEVAPYENKNTYTSVDIGMLYRATLIPERVLMATGIVFNDVYLRTAESNNSPGDALYITSSDSEFIRHSFFREIGAGILFYGALGVWLSGDISIDYMSNAPF